MNETFLKDSVRQLSSGMNVYVFKEYQIKPIADKCKKKYDLDVTYKKVDYYYILKPSRIISKDKRY